MLSVDLPCYTIEGKTILRNISLMLHEENLTILGANGTGKSTLAKILCGLYQTSETVKIDGTFLEEYCAKKRSEKINYIPPKLSIYDSFITVEDFLQLSRFRQTPREEQLYEILELLHLNTFHRRYCVGLSSGEQQLLLIASALMHAAKITIFDEPTANLDPQKIRRVFAILQSKRLKQKIVITHDLQFAYRLGYSVLYLRDGEGYFYASVKNFFSEENLMNIFQGSVLKQCDSVVVKL